MTTFFMISGYGFTVLKVFIFFILLHAVYPTFKYRYALLISCVAAPFYTQINDYLLYTMLSILLYILILFIGGCILVRKNFFVLILLSTFYVLMAGCIELFYITMMLNFSRHGARFFYVLHLEPDRTTIAFSLITKGCELVLVLITTAIIRRMSEGKKKIWKLLIATASGCFVMMYLMRKTFNNYFETPLLWIILIVFLLLLFAVLLFEIDLRNRQHILEKEALSKHLLEEKYLNLNEVYSQNARLYHDLNNHLIALDHLLDDANIPEAKKYIAAIQEPVQILKKTHWTGDDVVDAVLNNKIQIMENRKIHYEIQTDFPDKTGIEAADLCTLLANLLDNAIEACQASGQEKPYLRFSSMIRKKVWMIEVSNSKSSGLSPKKEGMKTTKEDTLNHGLGIGIISSIVSSYNGSLSMEDHGDYFETSAQLFLKKSSRRNRRKKKSVYE